MVIFFDIDGTLIDEKTQILPDSTAQAIHALVEAGHLAVVNTGRPYSHIDPRVRALPFAGWCCAVGQQVRLQDSWLKNQTVPKQWLPEAVELARQYGMQPVFEAEGGFYLDAQAGVSHPEIQFQCQLLRQHGGYIRDVSDGFDHEVVKFCGFEAAGGRTKEYMEALEPRYSCIWRRGMVEVICRGNSKATGMEQILRACNCAWSDTMAFGDSGNDLEMLRSAGIGVCMGGGAEAAQAAADYVTKSVLEDGILHALKHFEII